MKIKRISVGLIFMFFLPLWVMAQSENVDLGIIYKIKQEGLKNSSVEDLAFWLTDFTGPRLTGSTGNNRGNEWAKKKMEEFGFQNVRIEAARDFANGGWDNLKTYAAMTVPYYISFSCNPVAWSGSTNGLVKGNVVLLDVKAENDLDNYKGKLSGKIILMPSTATYEISYEPLASRLTDAQLKDLSMGISSPTQGRRPPIDRAAMMAQRALRAKITDFVKSEGALAIINSSGTFNVPRSNGANYTSGSPEPIAELNLPIEDYGRMERMLRHNVAVEMEMEI